MIGQTISHYNILAKLGEGGMGVVFKAEDTKLQRPVALKFLPQELTRNAEAKQRFIQEARAASALDHPNICTIHEFDETADGQLFIVMAYYDGETLKKKVDSGQLSMDNAIDYVIQIAQGLAKAHGHGITHRDIKPANVMITKDGVAKIVDFGLAKLTGQTKLTKTGATLGTVAYMSPEQARGEEVDHRADIWALGVVFYEMLTGQVPFKGDYELAVIYSILNENPQPITNIRTDVSIELQGVVNRALSKNPTERYQNINDLLAELKNIGQEITKETISKGIFKLTAQKEKKHRVFVAAMALLVILIAIIGYAIFKPTQEELPPWLQSNAPLKRITSESGSERGRISPDGNYLIYQDDRNAIKLKALGSGDINKITNSVGTGSAWSPDGTQIVFSKFDSTGSELLVYSLLGRVILRLPANGWAFNPVWSPDGSKLAYGTADISANLGIDITNLNGTPTKGFSMENMTPSLAWSADSRKLAVVESKASQKKRVIRTLDVETGTLSDPLEVIEAYSVPWWLGGLAWSPDGRYLIYVGDDASKNPELFALPMNPKTHAVAAAPIRITSLRGKGEPFWPTFTRGGMQLSFGIEEANEDIYALPINPRSATIAGRPMAVATNKQWDLDPCWTPDGKGVVFRSYRDGQCDLYRFDFETGETIRLTFNATRERYPQFSPDSKMITFSADSAIWGIPIDGGIAQKLTTDAIKVADRYAWSADGLGFFLTVADPSNANLFVLAKIGMGDSFFMKIMDVLAQTVDFTLSPDGRQLAICGIPVSKDSLASEKIVVLDLKNGEQKDLLTQLAITPRGRISWTHDGQFILHDRNTGSDEIIYELMPVKGGAPRRIKLDCGNLIGSILVGPIDPSGKQVLIMTQTSESDMWVLGGKE